MSPQKRRKDPTQPGSGGTARARAVDPESVIVLEAELPPGERPRRSTRRKPPPPLPRQRRRTLEVEVAQIEAEISSELPAVEAGRVELLFAPCHAATAYHRLGYRQAALLAAVDGKRSVGEIAARSGLDLDSVLRGLEALCAAGLIRRVR